MRFLLLIGFLVFLCGLPAMAQRKEKPVSFNRHYNEILPKDPQYKLGGWTIGPGATYMLTRFISRKETLEETASQRYEAKFTPLGKPGIYMEVGRYRMFRYNPVFEYYDYGLSYKSLRGSEKAEGTVVSVPGEAELASYDAKGSFGYHYLTAHFNLNHVWRIGKYNFIQNSIGANADYAIVNNYDRNSIPLAGLDDPGRFLVNLHYKIGYGIKMRGNWLLIPTLETPVLNFIPLELPRSSLGFFTSRYRPVIFSLRFFFMRPSDGMECTPVRTRDGKVMPTDMDKQRQLDEGGMR